MVRTFRDIPEKSLQNNGVLRLNTWKEIGAFFGRDERTVKRWEGERGLPVHRVPGGSRSTVYAYEHELEQWLHGRELGASGSSEPEITTTDVPAPSAPAPDGRPRRSVLRFWPIPAIAIAAAIIVVLSVRDFGSIRTPRTAAAPDPAALQLYDRGLHDWNSRTPEGLHMAVDEFTQAIVRAPTYAQAYVGLANCYNLLREYTDMPPAEAYPRARAAALRAIALDGSLAGGHRALAFEDYYWEWDVPAANREFRRALALGPDVALSHHWYANVLMEQARYGDALKEIDTAQHLDPISSSILSDKALILQNAGRVEEARAILDQMLKTDPSYMSPHIYLADVDLERGDLEGYLKEQAIAYKLIKDPNREAVQEAAENGWRVNGRSGMLRAMLTTQLNLLKAGQISPYEVARTQALIGDSRAALDYLRLAKATHDAEFINSATDWAFASLRAQPSFPRLAQRA